MNGDNGGQSGGYSRRDFLKVLGAGTGLAVTGCAEELPEKIIPYVVQPDEVIPGVSTWYRSSCTECSAGCGILVRTREGRALKVEGNPDHPVNRGGLCAHGQSAIQAHYDPDRIREPLRREPSGAFRPVSWGEAMDQLAEASRALGDKRGLLLTPPVSGSLRELVGDLRGVVANLKHIELDISPRETLERAAAVVFGPRNAVEFDFAPARVIASFGADFLETWISPVEHARQWAAGRRPGDALSYFVHFEPRLSLTAGNADRWVKNAPGSEPRLLAALLKLIVEQKASGGALDQFAAGLNLASLLEGTEVSERTLRHLAGRLVSSPSSLVVAGGATCGSPFESALLALLVNVALGSLNRTVHLANVQRAVAAEGSYEHLRERLADIRSGKEKIGLFFIAGLNPLYAMPRQAGFGDALGNADLVVAASSYLDETTNAANLVLPLSSSFESWGDAEVRPGVHNLHQPSMAPLYQTQSLGDTLLALGLRLKDRFTEATSFQDYIKRRWQRRAADRSESEWQRQVEQGGEWTDAVERRAVSARPELEEAVKLLSPVLARKPTDDLTFVVYPSVNSFDGRAANRPWMQELPNPVTSVVWGSWVELHPETAARYGLAQGEVAQVRTAQGVIEAPVLVTRHVHPRVVAMPLGQGHDAYGRYAAGVGANGLSILAPDSASGVIPRTTPLLAAAPLQRALSHDRLVRLQGHDSQEGRGIVRTVRASEAAHGKAADRHGDGHGGAQSKAHSEVHGEAAHGDGHHAWALGPKEHPPQMYEQMEHPLYRWGMAIDVASCTGCSACVVACYAENNIPVVGKDICAQGREMAWIRIERYLEESDEDQPLTGFLPMLCQHCGNAPCESVCPVYATYHNEEGLNTMVYNRCVGTRYCSNNCSYKVRRFNWFHYKWPEPLNWQLNPDVTVREVGIMEKCTFCVQRIAEARNQAKNLGRPIADGEVQPACASSCPTKAIAFGNLLDESSAVAKLTRSDRAYKVLDEMINTQPAVSYLARMRNDSGGES